MPVLLLSPLLSFVLCLLLTPLCRSLARKCGLVDRPDSRRKLHGRPIPVAGGLGILLAGIVALAVAHLLLGSLHDQHVLAQPYLGGLLLSSLIICALGVVDDYGRLRGQHKLLGQLLAVAVVMGFGVRIHTLHLFGWTFDLGLLALPFTAFVLLGAINSLNLIDGMDGLLSSVGLIICLGFGGMAIFGGQLAAASIALTLAGALLAFLCYNFPPASIFLGDCGSMLVGLTVGVLAIQSSLKAPATVALATPTALLIIPIFDTTAAILRRKLTGRSIYSTDRGHLHHCLLRRGLTTRGVLLLVCGCCLATVAGTLVSLLFKNEALAILSAVVVIVLLVLGRLFGHAELHLVLRRLQGLIPPLLSGQDWEGARAIEVRLQGSADWGELWQRITASAPMLNLRRIRFDVNAPAINEGYHARWYLGHEELEDTGLWQVILPLCVQGNAIGHVEVIGYRDAKPVWEKIATLARMVHHFESVAPLALANALEAPTAKALSVSDLFRPQEASLAQTGQIS